MGDTVKVVVGLTSAAVTTGLHKLKHQFKEFREEANKEFSVGELFAAGALVEGLHSIIEEANEIVNVSRRFGVMASSLQRIGNAAKEDGASMEMVGQAMNKLLINQQKVKEGDEKMRKALDDLKISQEEYVNMNAEEGFFKIADAVKEADDDTAAYAAVVTLLGKSAGTLITTLRRGSEEIKKIGDAAGVMDDETAEHLKEAGETWERAMHRIKMAAAESFSWIAKAAKEVGLVIGTVAAILTGTSNKDAGIAYAEGHKEIWHPEEEHEHEKHKPHRDLEDTEKELEARKKYAEETDKLNEKIDKQNRDAELAALDTAHKILALTEERDALLRGMDDESDRNKRLEAIEKVNEVEKQMNEERAKAAREEETHQEKIMRLRESIEKKNFEISQLGLTEEQQRIGLEMRRDDLKHKAEHEDDEEKKLQATSEYLDLVKELGNMDGKHKDDKAAVDAMTKIGGNANVGVGFKSKDPIAERTAKSSEKVAKAVEKSNQLLGKIEKKLGDPRWNP